MCNNQMHFAKCLYNYSSLEPGDLELSVGQVVRVIEWVDDQWIRGETVGLMPHVGIFPACYVQVFKLPNFSENETPFVAVEDFLDIVDETNLRLRKGDILIGTYDMGGGWWYGKLNSTHGTFPITCVAVLIENQKPMKTEARAIIDNKGQIDGELSFTSGDTVWITKIIDDVFCEGWRGKEFGMFPLDSVNVIDKSTFHNIFPNPNLSNSVSVDNSNFTDSPVLSINERNRRHRESVTSEYNSPLTSEISQSDPRPKLGSFTSENMSTADEQVQAYATAIAPFVGQNIDELTFMAGDIIRLIQHVDQEWTQGEVTTPEGTWRGIFPTQFVEIIVDCQPVAHDTTENHHHVNGGNLEDDCEHIYVDADDPLRGTKLTALYDFYGERGDDLRFNAGEVLTIIRAIDANWYQAENGEGNIGQCPKMYLSSPEEKFKSNQKPSVPPKPVLRKVSSSKATNENSKADVFSSKWSKQDKLDDIIKNEIQEASKKQRVNRTDASYRPISTIIPQTKTNESDNLSSSPAANARPLSCSISNEMIPQIEADKLKQRNNSPFSPTADKPQIRKKPPPPRPQLPRSLSVKSSDENNQSNTQSDIYEPIPRRPAPPRPLPVIPKSSQEASDGKFNFKEQQLSNSDKPESVYMRMLSSNSSLTRGQRNTSAVGDINKRIRDIESEIQRNQEDIESIKRRAFHHPDEEADKSRTLQFCTENVKMLQDELIHLRSVLSQVCSSSNSLSRDSEGVDHQTDSIYESLEDEYEDIEKLRSTSAADRNTNSADLAAAKEKRYKQRCNVINELLTSEIAYLKDLRAIEYSFDKEKMSCKISEGEQDVIFSNIQDLANLSESFKNSVEESVNKQGSGEALIGHCFLTLRNDFERCYVDYCTNHDDTIKLLSRDDQPYLDAFVNEGLNRMRTECQINPMNLATMLIKPVQRLLKYPLLLSGILSSTEDDHLDKEKLHEAISEMTKVASLINEQKRKKELTTKYLMYNERKSTLTIHSLKKATGRFSQILHKKIIGAGDTTSDPEFDKEENHFNQLRKTVKALIRSAKSSRDVLKDMMEKQVNLAFSVCDVVQDRSSELGQEADQYRIACDSALEIFKERYWNLVENRAIGPLEKLLPLLNGPIKLINKRGDKLLDYNRLELAMKKAKESNHVTRALTDELVEAEKIYQAMNDQLKEELPLLNKMISSLFKECIFNYVQAMKEFSDNVLNKLVPLLEIYSHSSHGGLKGGLSICLESCVTQHARIIEDLSNMTLFSRPVSTSQCVTPNPIANSIAPGSSQRFATLGRHSVSSREAMNFDFKMQDDEQKYLLRQKYTADNLYLVIHPYKPNQPLELELQDGDLVGVMKKADPMGNKKRWMVDKGNKEFGFVPSSILQQENATNQPVSSSGIGAGGENTTHWYFDIGAEEWDNNRNRTADQSNSKLTVPTNQKKPRPVRHTIGPATGTRIVQNQQKLEEICRGVPLIQIEETTGPDLEPEKKALFGPPSYDQHIVNLPLSGNNEASPSRSPNSRNSFFGDSTDSNQSRQSGNNYVALYQFNARNSNEMTVTPGECLYVLQRHDHSLNPEWWMVSNGVRQGYVPANYLSKKI